jgi:purine-binding chemotaxis protein CheW
MTGQRQVCTFLLEGLLFGIEVELVQEVIRFQPLSTVPLAPPEIAGLINLRGQIVAALDLRRRLGLPARSQATLPANLVVRTRDGPLSLLVDEIGEVTEVDQEQIESLPGTIDPQVQALLRGVYQLGNSLLLLLDSQKAVSVATASADMG